MVNVVILMIGAGVLLEASTLLIINITTDTKLYFVYIHKHIQNGMAIRLFLEEMYYTETVITLYITRYNNRLVTGWHNN